MVIDNPATLAAVTAALDAFFWESAAAVRYGVGENLYGAREITAFRARRGGAPERRLRRIAVSTFGTQFGSACVEYVRPADPVIGRQTQS